MGLPILCYHKVGRQDEEGRWLCIPPHRLDSHIRFFRRRGRRFVLPRELGEEWPDDSVCFTFDDAYESAVAGACPLFLRHGVRCAFFPVAGKVGGVSDWDEGRERRLAPWEELLRAEWSGFEIGNHTLTHPRLPELPSEGQSLEIQRAHEELLRRGLRSETVCYPYGAWNAQTLSAATESGYRVGLALGKRPAEAGDPRLALPRIAIAYGDGLPLLVYKLHVRPRLSGRPKISSA